MEHPRAIIREINLSSVTAPSPNFLSVVRGRVLRPTESTDFDGVAFASRHGDDLALWAIFERPGDATVSSKIRNVLVENLRHDSQEICDAFAQLGLQWEIY